MKKYYRKYLILAITGSIIIGLAFYLLLNNYLDKREIIVASRDINAGEKIGEDDLYFKEYY
ncbi:MAG TPA: SAF domain-containing protein, partial [Candidatus Lokiarchaeia archaeon]